MIWYAVNPLPDRTSFMLTMLDAHHPRIAHGSECALIQTYYNTELQTPPGFLANLARDIPGRGTCRMPQIKPDQHQPVPVTNHPDRHTSRVRRRGTCPAGVRDEPTPQAPTNYIPCPRLTTYRAYRLLRLTDVYPARVRYIPVSGHGHHVRARAMENGGDR